MVFFALCAQCAATLAVIKRESGHWGWAVFVFAYMTALAWVAAAGTYAVALQLGWG
jgi:ferrous iron transport protein B